MEDQLTFVERELASLKENPIVDQLGSIASHFLGNERSGGKLLPI
jgi:hypothetical protein